MEILLQNLGKKFIRQWIFRNIDFQVRTGEPVAITGPNGSGKSTLLRILAGWMLPSEGAVTYMHQDSSIAAEKVYRYVDYVAPYLELVEELTLRELIEFHFRFKSLEDGLDTDQIMAYIDMSCEKDKQILNFSSGMKQRLKLGLAFCSQSPILLLDEPLSNLDEVNRAWYKEKINILAEDRLLIIASNDRLEYELACKNIHIPDYTLN